MAKGSHTPVKAVPHIVAILDISGSMESIKADAIGAYNTFIDEQKALGEDAKLTVVLFDDKYQVLQEGADIKDAIKFDNGNFVPRGMTAMNDAIGRTIVKFKAMAEKGELAAGALFTIVTDGDENASREYTSSKIKELITEAESKLGWTFVYLAANQDAFAKSQTLGIKSANTMNFAATGAGVRAMASSMSGYATLYRTTHRDPADANLAVAAKVDDGTDPQK